MITLCVSPLHVKVIHLIVLMASVIRWSKVGITCCPDFGMCVNSRNLESCCAYAMPCDTPNTPTLRPGLSVGPGRHSFEFCMLAQQSRYSYCRLHVHSPSSCSLDQYFLPANVVCIRDSYHTIDMAVHSNERVQMCLWAAFCM